MLRTVLAGALVAGALASGGVAQAHGYGYDDGRPAYAGGYAPYQGSKFTLLGARAGVTVLGVDLDASAKLTVGVHGWGGHASPPPPQEAYGPQPPEYGPPMYEEPMGYGPPPPPRRWMGYSYSYSPCGC